MHQYLAIDGWKINYQRAYESNQKHHLQLHLLFHKSDDNSIATAIYLCQSLLLKKREDLAEP